MSDSEDSVDIPPEVRARYIERRRQDLETLLKATETGRFEDFCRVGHQLKGNAASFGYAELEKIGIQLEQIGLAEDSSGAKRTLELLQSWLDSQPR
jgi:HPt (histidine-containing phosphotransfer) domain-containing protein